MADLKILLVEDDKCMAFLVNRNLQAASYDVQICQDGESALNLFKKEQFGLCILDIMLPRMDGFTLAREIRKMNKRVPLIFLTARNRIQDKETGFKIGADDYVTKPFGVKELLLRIEAIIKRTNNRAFTAGFEQVQIGQYEFNYLTRQLKKNNKSAKLSGKEAELLNVFVENLNQLVPRQMILQRVWGTDGFFAAKSMDVYLTRIRKLIGGDPAVELQNVHGVGYRMIVRETDAA